MQNPNWPQIPDHPHGILIIGRSKSGEANALLNLININQILIKYTSYMQKILVIQSINY